MGQRAVVGQEEHSLDVVVEPTHRIEAYGCAHQVGDHRAAAGIAARGDVTARLVQEHIVQRSRAAGSGRPSTVMRSAPGSAKRSRLPRDGAVHRHATLDESDGHRPAARSDPPAPGSCSAGAWPSPASAPVAVSSGASWGAPARPRPSEDHRDRAGRRRPGTPESSRTDRGGREHPCGPRCARDGARAGCRARPPS